MQILKYSTTYIHPLDPETRKMNNFATNNNTTGNFKKSRYLSDYIQSLQRKVLYTEPIFLTDVKFKSSTEKTGASAITSSNTSTNATHQFEVVTSSSSSWKYDKFAFGNIAKFSSSNIQSKRAVSQILRQILLERKITLQAIGQEHSMVEKITNVCKQISAAFVGKFDTLAFEVDMFSKLEKTESPNVLVIDFDTSNEQESNVAAMLKYLYLGQTGKLTFNSQQSVVNFMKARRYQLKANCILTFMSGVIPVYGLLFTSHD